MLYEVITIGLDLKAKLFGRPQAPMVVDFVAGLGGREINTGTVHRLVSRAEEIHRSGQVLAEPEWVGVITSYSIHYTKLYEFH